MKYIPTILTQILLVLLLLTTESAFSQTKKAKAAGKNEIDIVAKKFQNDKTYKLSTPLGTREITTSHIISNGKIAGVTLKGLSDADWIDDFFSRQRKQKVFQGFRDPNAFGENLDNHDAWFFMKDYTCNDCILEKKHIVYKYKKTEQPLNGQTDDYDDGNNICEFEITVIDLKRQNAKSVDFSF